MRLLGMRILTQYLRDGDLGPAASISKLYWSGTTRLPRTWRWRSWAQPAWCPKGTYRRAYRTDDPGAPNSSASWEHVWMLNAASGTVWGRRVQRNILGESILGLPKEPSADESGRRPSRTTCCR